MVGEGIGQANLPIVVVPHPVGDRDESVVRQHGVRIAEQCVRLLTTPVGQLERELAGKQHPLPEAVMPR